MEVKSPALVRSGRRVVLLVFFATESNDQKMSQIHAW